MFKNYLATLHLSIEKKKKRRYFLYKLLISLFFFSFQCKKAKSKFFSFFFFQFLSVKIKFFVVNVAFFLSIFINKIKLKKNRKKGYQQQKKKVTERNDRKLKNVIEKMISFFLIFILKMKEKKTVLFMLFYKNFYLYSPFHLLFLI